MYRSRLQRVEEKRNLRRATVLSLGTILVIVAVIVLGIPLLIRMAVLLGDIKSSSRPVDKNDLIPPVPPRLSISYDATNSATQTIAGSAEPGSAVWLTLNGESAGDVVAAEDGGWSLSNVRLDEGDNKLSAVAIDQGGNKSAPSSEVDLYYSQQPPELNISSPTENQQISSTSVEVSGITSAGVRLTVSSRLIIVTPEGKFSTPFSLVPGENTLVFIATDRAGNQTRKELTVTSQ